MKFFRRTLETVSDHDVRAGVVRNDPAQMSCGLATEANVCSRGTLSNRDASAIQSDQNYKMKTFVKRWKHMITLAAIVMLGVAVFCLGMTLGIHPVNAFATGGAIIALGQLSQFALSKRSGVCYQSVLTPEQVKEFGQILDGLKEYKDLFPELKRLPGAVEKLNTDVERLRRLGLGGTSQEKSGQWVSDGCAKWLAACLIVGGEKKGKLELMEATKREALLAESGRILGIKERTAITSSDIPMPTAYSGEVVALVSQFGAARKYGTLFPLGAGTVKLPKLTTDPTFGLIAQSGSVNEKSPQVGWVTFTAEKFGGLIRIPSEMSEDSIIGLGNFIAEYAARNLAYVEDYQFFLSTGGASGINGTAKGLCFSTIDNSKVVQMANTNTTYAHATLTNFRTLRTKVDAAALGKSAYYLHPTFEALLAGFNTAGDKPYNPQAQIIGSGANPMMVGPTLDGFPIRWVDAMPAYSTSVNASKVFALFGDLRYQYLGIVGGSNGVRITTSVDAAFETDELLIRALERLTIGLMATGAIAGLETAAT